MNKSRFLAALAVAGLGLALFACGKEEAPKTEAPKASAPAAAIDPATAATVTGIIKFDGAAPKPRRIRMDAEPTCAAQHGAGVFDEEISVDGGNLANVIVYVKDGLGDRTFNPPATSITLDQHGCLYKPRVLGVMAGQNIEIINSDKTTHNIHPVPTINREWNKSQPAGASPIVESFAREEIPMTVKCNIHPWMKAYIAVFKHPYFAVTGKTGSFSLANLPPGAYTIEAWHEKLGASTQSVTVGAKESKAITFTFKAPAASGD